MYRALKPPCMQLNYRTRISSGRCRCTIIESMSEVFDVKVKKSWLYPFRPGCSSQKKSRNTTFYSFFLCLFLYYPLYLVQLKWFGKLWFLLFLFEKSDNLWKLIKWIREKKIKKNISIFCSHILDFKNRMSLKSATKLVFF